MIAINLGGKRHHAIYRAELNQSPLGLQSTLCFLKDTSVISEVCEEKMSRFNLLCMLTFWTCFAAREPPTVDIPGQGRIMGKEISRYRSQKIIGYYGIPYAQPPIDDLRFAPPDTANLATWEGVRNLTDYMPACLQTESDIREEAKPFLQLIYPSYSNMTMDEDCLYLNVFVPFGKEKSIKFE